MKTCVTYFSKFLMAMLVMGFIGSTIRLEAQYAPPAGVPGTTALSADSAVFVDWASSCVFEAGWLDISNQLLGVADYGQPADVAGKADNLVLSLGDGGVATCSFATPLADGPGWDFAVFENSFDDTFLELAFVEVSSDGEHFVRFQATSLTQTETQIVTFGTLDATLLNNLAGKYRYGFGVPFDLSELSGVNGLDVHHIVAVRLIDVVGSITPPWQNPDGNGHVINDPWPTPFNVGGFDLDAVGVIHNLNNTAVIEVETQLEFSIYPNPIDGPLYFQSEHPVTSLSVFSAAGKVMFQSYNESHHTITTYDWPSGIYIARVVSENQISTSKFVKTE